MRSRPSVTISWQAFAIAIIGAADLASTVWLCQVRNGAEANPLMAWFLAQGVLAFAAAKVLLTAGPLVILEWVRRSRPRLALIALNTALLGYLGLYSAGLARINNAPSIEEAERQVNHDPVAAATWEQIQLKMAAKFDTRPPSDSRIRYAQPVAENTAPSTGVAGGLAPAL